MTRGMSMTFDWVDEDHDLASNSDYTGPGFYLDTCAPSAFGSWDMSLTKLTNATAIELAKSMDALTGSQFEKAVRDTINIYVKHLEVIVQTARDAAVAATNAQAELDTIAATQEKP
jgi:hypothetical protein